MWLTTAAQNVTREISAGPGSVITVVNKYGRISAVAVNGKEVTPSVARLSAASPKGVSDSEIKIVNSTGQVTITDAAGEAKKRIDLSLVVPERAILRLETDAGAIDASGNFASVDARSETGTIAADVPEIDITSLLQWTE